jgi:hypothetical protein
MRAFVLSLLVLAFVGAGAAAPRMVVLEELTSTT